MKVKKLIQLEIVQKRLSVAKTRGSTWRQGEREREKIETEMKSKIFEQSILGEGILCT